MRTSAAVSAIIVAIATIASAPPAHPQPVTGTGPGFERPGGDPRPFLLTRELPGFRVQENDGKWVLPDPPTEVVVLVEKNDGEIYIEGPSLLVAGHPRGRSELGSQRVRTQPYELQLRFSPDESPLTWALTLDQVWGWTTPEPLRNLLESSFSPAGLAIYPRHPAIDVVLGVFRPDDPLTRFRVNPAILPEDAGLPRVHALDLTITDETGTPEQGADVALTIDGSWWSFTSKGTLDEMGSISLPCVMDNTFPNSRLRLYGADGARETTLAKPGCPGRLAITLGDHGSDRERVSREHVTSADEIQPALRHLGNLRGTIYGEPAASTTWILLATSLGANDEPDRFLTVATGGDFEFASVPEGVYDVQVFGRPDLTREMTTTDVEKAVFNASPSTPCKVRVLHGDAPMAGARLWLESEMDPMHRGAGAAPITDSTGRARLEVKRRERLIPYLELGGEQGRVFLVLAPIEATEVEEACSDELVVELPDSSVRVEVRNSGAAEAGASVAAHRAVTDQPAEGVDAVMTLKGTTGPAGTIDIPGLAAGRWVIYAGTEEGAKTGSREIVLRKDEVLGVRIDVQETP